MKYLAVFSLCLLAGCSISGKQVGVFTSLSGLVLGVDPTPTSQASVLENVPDSITIARVNRSARASMNFTSQNGDITRYDSGGQISVSLRNGVVVKTNGLGGDLAGFQQTIPLGPQPTTSFTRIHRFTDGNLETVTLVFDCARYFSDLKSVIIARQPTPVRELREECFNNSISFENSYIWLRSNGALYRSRQWITPEIEDVIIVHR